jgi:hypothetical protein
MMSGGDINPIKTRRIGPESVEYAEGFLDKFDKNFMDREAETWLRQRRAIKTRVSQLCGLLPIVLQAPWLICRAAPSHKVLIVSKNQNNTNIS